MKRIIAVLLIPMLCACGVMIPPKDNISNKSTDNLSADNNWVGHTIDELVVLIGEPFNVYMLEGGGRMFEYLRHKKNATTSTQPSLSAEAERARRIYAKRKNLDSDPSQDCKILFKVSASDIIESWSIKCEKQN